MNMKKHISIISIILAALATTPIVYAQNTLLLRAKDPTAVSVSASADKTTQATLVVRETPFEMAEWPQPIYSQYLKDLMTVEGADEIDINEVG